jgi:hypothetical protein
MGMRVIGRCRDGIRDRWRRLRSVVLPVRDLWMGGVVVVKKSSARRALV